MSATETAESLVAVRLVGFPLQVYLRSAEHHDGLMREFALLAMDPPVDVPGHEVPAKLRDLVDTLGRQYGGFTDRANATRDDALAAGQDSVDLVYEVPPQAAEAARALGEMLDQADEFCRNGDLLTLATPPEAMTFRRWYLDEFSRQIGGEAPRPWAEFAQQGPA